MDELLKLKKDELIKLCKEKELIIKGNKHDLASRIIAHNLAKSVQENVLQSANDIKLETVKDYEHFYRGKVFTSDLRLCPKINFGQVHLYLVCRSSKYNASKLCGTEYKVLKAYRYFMAGKVQEIMSFKCGKSTYLKAKCGASMACIAYVQYMEIDDKGNIQRGVCSCPAGCGVKGLGKCNHIAAIIFALEHATTLDLHSLSEKVSCTSKLAQWVVPRKLRVDPVPLKEIQFQKIKYGKTNNPSLGTAAYDPRDTASRSCDRNVMKFAKDFKNFCPQSGLFLHRSDTQFLFKQNEDTVEIESMAEEVPPSLVNPYKPPSPQNSVNVFRNDNLPFNDQYDITCSNFHAIVEHTLACHKIAVQEIEKIKLQTIEQAKSPAWFNCRQKLLTASNFKSFCIRRKEPSPLLQKCLYKNSINCKNVSYGRDNEINAISDYSENTGFTIKPVGLWISKEQPFLGASLDGLVYDGTSVIGGLEVKCPISKKGSSPSEIDGDFYLHKFEGKLRLNRNHAYYYQVQGQIFVSQLPWVDFVVWFGPKSLFIEKIFFDALFWDLHCARQLDHFLRFALIPELLTKRVFRGVQLYPYGGWKSYGK